MYYLDVKGLKGEGRDQKIIVICVINVFIKVYTECCRSREGETKLVTNIQESTPQGGPL